MRLKLFLLISFTLLFGEQVQAQDIQTLSQCESEVCSRISHNKNLEKVSILVWDNQSQILHAAQFELDRDAELVSQSDSISGFLRGSSSGSSTTLDMSNPPSCGSSGTCVDSSSRSYLTTTHIVTITTIFTFVNGELIDVDTHKTEVERPDDDRHEQ